MPLVLQASRCRLIGVSAGLPALHRAEMRPDTPGDNWGRCMQVCISLLWFMALTSGAAYAQAPQVQRLDLTDYGIYSIDREISGRDERGITLGSASNVLHTATQRTVRAQVGVTFGFRYRVIGKPNGETVTLKKIITFPSPGLQTPASSNPVTKAEFEVEAQIGEMNSELYTLEDNFELVPG